MNRPSDIATVLAALDPVSQSAATVVTSWVPITDVQSILAVLAVGALGTSATVDAKLRQATNSSGGSAKDITGKAITQLTKAGSDDNKQVLLNVRPDELDMANGFTHIALSITVATAACLISAVLLGFNARFQPKSHATTVDEVVG